MNKDDLNTLLKEKNQLFTERIQMKSDVSQCKSTVAELSLEVKKALEKQTDKAVLDDPIEGNSADLPSLMARLNGAVESLTNLEEKYSEFDERLNNFGNILTIMNNNINTTLNEMKQYSMVPSLIIRKLPNVPTKINNFKFINYICNELNYLLPELKMKLNYFLIEAAHPLPVRDGDESPSVIVRFKYRANRNDVFFNKKFLKGSKIRITEHLTPSNIELLEKVQKYVGVRQSWTRNGKIFATISDKKHQIKDLTELDKLIEHYELTELSSEEIKTRDLRKNRDTMNHRNNRAGSNTQNQWFQSPQQVPTGSFSYSHPWQQNQGYTNGYNNSNYYGGGAYNSQPPLQQIPFPSE